MRNVLVIAPHPDDETLGCGGTILKHKSDGDRVSWLIVTAVSEGIGYTSKHVGDRHVEIEKVRQMYDFNAVYECNFPTTQLDTIPISELVRTISEILRKSEPDTVYIPFSGDAHTDHRIVFDAVSACLKWFRCLSLKRALVYETLSETGISFVLENNHFNPNVFVNIKPFLEKKIDIMKIYSSELGAFPFPRSEEAIRAQAASRGAISGFEAAESFMLLKEMVV